jgi:uncharacterized protein (DUF1778 family)/predicted RNA-binding protein with TRAM domain
MQQRFKWCILLALLCSSLLLWPRLQQALLAAPEERAAPQQLLQGLSEPLAEEEAWVIWESDTPIQRITAQSQQIWAGTSHKGLVGWGRDSGPTQIYTSTHGLNGLDILASAFDQAGNLWVASHDGGISRIDEQGHVEDLTPESANVLHPWDLAIDGDTVWLATIGQGVWRYHEEDWSQISGNELHLPSQDIYAIALEANGTPWVGTMGYGIASYRDEEWHHYLPPFQMAHPLTQDLVDNHAITAIGIDADGTRWFASDGSGVAAFDSEENWTVYSSDNSGLTSDFVQSITIDAEGNYWFGTLNGGVSILSADRSTWTSYTSANAPLREDDILDIAFDADGGVWLASYDAGLSYYGSLAAEAPLFALDPRQQPELAVGQKKAYYLWQDAKDYTWNLAWTGDAEEHHFQGELIVDGLITLSDTLELEQEDSVLVDNDRLLIDASESDGLDHVQFTLDRAAQFMTLKLQIDGAYYPFHFVIGAQSAAPGSAPFQLPIPQPQLPELDVILPETISEGELIYITGRYTDSDTWRDHAFTWNLGDGSVITDTAWIEYAYGDNGDYDITFTLTNTLGMVNAVTVPITVANLAPEVWIEDYSYPAVWGEPVTFVGDYYDPGQFDTHSITWDFGDGSSPLVTSALTVTHTYLSSGVYTTTLTVIDNDGAIGIDQWAIQVLNEAPVTPTPSATATPSSTPTLEATETPTSTPTATHTVEVTETPTSTPTATHTVEVTETPTSTPTATYTVEVTETPTSTPTATYTVEVTETPTNTPTATHTVEVTETPTNTPTATYTVEVTETPTSTPTATATSQVSIRLKEITFENGALSHSTSGVDSVVVGTGSLAITTTGALRGDYAAQLVGGASTYLREDISASDELYVSFLIRLDETPSAGASLLRIYNGSTQVGNLFLNMSQRLVLRQDATQVGSVSDVLQTGTVYRVGIRQVRGAGDGILEAFLVEGNSSFGAPFASSSSQTITSGATRLNLGAAGSSGSLTLTLDDIVLDAASMPAPLTGVPEATHTPTSTPTATHTVEVTNTPTATHTVEVTHTPSSTPTATATAGVSIRLKEITFEDGMLSHSTSGVDSVVVGTGSLAITTTGALRGDYAVQLVGGASTYLREDISASDELYVSFLIRLDQTPSAGASLLRIYNGSTQVGNLFLNMSRRLVLRQDATQVGSVSDVLQTGTVYRVGIRQVRGAGDGILEAFLVEGNSSFGAPFASSSSQTITSGATRLNLGAPGSSGSLTLTLDDIILDAASMPAPLGPSAGLRIAQPSAQWQVFVPLVVNTIEQQPEAVIEPSVSLSPSFFGRLLSFSFSMREHLALYILPQRFDLRFINQ